MNLWISIYFQNLLPNEKWSLRTWAHGFIFGGAGSWGKNIIKKYTQLCFFFQFLKVFIACTLLHICPKYNVRTTAFYKSFYNTCILNILNHVSYLKLRRSGQMLSSILSPKGEYVPKVLLQLGNFLIIVYYNTYTR